MLYEDLWINYSNRGTNSNYADSNSVCNAMETLVAAMITAEIGKYRFEYRHVAVRTIS